MSIHWLSHGMVRSIILDSSYRMVLSANMAFLAVVGALRWFGYSRVLWNSQHAWIRSLVMVRSLARAHFSLMDHS